MRLCLSFESVTIEPSPITTLSMAHLLSLEAGRYSSCVYIGVVGVEEVERRQRLGQGEVGLEERPHCADVLPVPLEDVREELLPSEQAGDHLPAEIGH